MSERPLTGDEAVEVNARFVRETITGRGTGRPRGIVTDPLPPAPVPAGPTDAQAELREVIVEALNLAGACCGWCGREPGDPLGDCPDCNRHLGYCADAVLALPAVRAALDAQETVRRVEELADQFKALAGSHERSVAHLVNGEYRADQIGLAMGYTRAALALRRALAGHA